MKDLRGTKRWLAAIGVAGGLLLFSAGGVTAHAASTTRSTASASPTPSPMAQATPKARAKGRTLLSRADHATVEIEQDGKRVTYDIDRGNVTAATASSITLNRLDGQSVTLSISSSTKFRGRKRPAPPG